MIERQNSLPMTCGASCKVVALVVVLLVSGQVAAQETIREKGPAPEQTTVPTADSDAASQGSSTAPEAQA
jgi:hypothetical protein